MNLLSIALLLAVVAVTTAIENKRSSSFHKTIKELGDEIRDRKNLEYSYSLPHSHVASFRSLERRISSVPSDGPVRNLYQGRQTYGSNRRTRPYLPAPSYAVQMEPMVQYSQKDPLYDANGENLEDGITRNEIQAQPKILTVKLSDDQISEGDYSIGNIYAGEHVPPAGPPYGPVLLPYYEHPEPIIEIIIKESNESLPAVPIIAPPVAKRPKEPVQVFYVKYQQDPHGGENDVIYDKPIPAITPPSNGEPDHHEEYTTVAPEVLTLSPPPTTTLRAIIRPESEHYHSDSGIRITFGSSEHGAKSREFSSSEGHEESAPHVAVAFPNPEPTSLKLTQSATSHFQKRQQVVPREYQQQFQQAQPFQQNSNQHSTQNQHQAAQQRIQSQPTNSPFNFQQLPLPNTPNQPFRSTQNQFPRLQSSPLFKSLPPVVQGSIRGSTQNFPTAPHNSPPRNPSQNFQGPPSFSNTQQRPFTSPSAPRGQFKQNTQRPFHQGPQPQHFQFNEHEYLQQNYHTITADQLEPLNDQQPPNTRPLTNFREPQRSPVQTPITITQEEYNKRYNEQVQYFKNKEQQRQRPQLVSTPQTIVGSKFQHHSEQQKRPSLTANTQPNIISNTPQTNIVSIGQSKFNSQNVRTQNSPPQVIQHSLHPQIIQHNPPPQLIQHNPPPQIIQHNPPPQLIQHNPPPQVIQQNPHPQVIHQNPPPQLVHQNPHPSPIPTSPPVSHQIVGSQFIPPGGEVIASVPKYEQHLLIQPTTYVNGLQHTQQSQQFPQASPLIQHFPPQNSQKAQQTQHQNINKNISPDITSDFLSVFEQNQREILELQEKLRKSEEEQQKLLALTQLSVSTSKPQVRPFVSKNQQQQRYSSNKDEQVVQIQARNPQTKPYTAHSTNRPPLLSSTGRPNSIEVSTTSNYFPSSTKSTEKIETTKKEKTKKPIEFELPDEVPDDLREQLLSSGILENAQISILDYDKVGDIPLESLPPEQLANFYGAGGGLQISGSAPVASVIKTNGDKIVAIPQRHVGSESENRVVSVNSKKRDVEMKVVHFDPSTTKGQQVAEKYVQDGAKQVEPVSLNDNKYNRYLPLKVSGAHFPLPDVPELVGRKVTSVVVLAPVNYDSTKSDAGRSERAAPERSQGVNFVAGDALKRLVKMPSLENYKKWLEKENNTSPDLQSVVLLVTGSDSSETEDKEIFMYDVATQTVSKLSGELSSAFVDVAETNAHSKDFDEITVANAGVVESSVKVIESKVSPVKSKDNKYANHKSTYSEVDSKKHIITDKNKQRVPDYGSRISNVEAKRPSFIRKSATNDAVLFTDDSTKPANQVLINSGYSRMKMGRALDDDDDEK